MQMLGVFPDVHLEYQNANSMQRLKNLVSTPTVKLQDVAERLGVSIATVSRALAGSDLISSTTREAVQVAAAEIGYRLPTQGRKVRKSATRLVGVVVGALHNQFMTRLLEHLHDALQEAGYQVTLLIDSMSDPQSLQAFRPLIDGYLDGMIFATATLDSPVVRELKRRGIPVVLVVRSVDDAGTDTVEIDNVQAGAEAARHLVDLGHRDIGLVMGPENTSTSRDRVAGALQCLERAGIPNERVPLVWGDYTTESGYSGALQLLQQPAPVTAIAAGNDTIAFGVLEAAKRNGVSVPGQLSVIGFDDSPIAGSPLIGLTTICQPVEALARTAARRLVEKMHSGRLGTTTHDILPVQLIRRETTGVPLLNKRAS